MNANGKSIRIWFFNNPDSGRFLIKKSELGIEPSSDLQIEIASGSVLARYFNLDSPQDFPGISGIINHNWRLDELAIKPEESETPIVFASPNSEPPTVLGSSLQALKNQDFEFDCIDVFIEISLIESLLPWLHGFDGIGILFSLDCAPCEKLMSDLSKIINEGLLENTPWNGIIAYSNTDVTREPTDEIHNAISQFEEVPGANLISALSANA